MNAIIEVNQLSRSFGKKDAVKGLNLVVPEGTVFAFLGPNGAGKTTTIKTIMNIIEPSSGTAKVFGKDSRQLQPADFASIGYISENQKMPEWMTVQQLLDYCKPFYPTWDDDFVAKLQAQFKLPLNEKIKSLSRGMKVKAALLSSLAYRPRLLVLDEPFSGLDPLVRDEFIRGVLEITEREQWTIFISSHDIDEVERLADWVGIIAGGELKVSESITNLQERFRIVHVVTENTGPLPSKLPKQWLTAKKEGHTVTFVDSNFKEDEIEHLLQGSFPDKNQIEVQPMSLRDIFLTLAKTYQITA